ncbi:pentatricopeptide repeat-containing protein At5g66520-like [Cucurbita pepo subsp. pepo]|uniref:pentatricopeptide repeat-containing protein At5g66520-like n=1 Tax=Cucurbita pepo subsp. pepo TaxID=3664 RepID=UPI000C9D5889|nr:pentatricopeptide repeat-containing protein At5g66520-like [Cucurbita pepo subsp. pepo]
MLLSRSSHLLNPARRQFALFAKGFNSWALRIRNAPSLHKALAIYSQMHRQSVPHDSFSILFVLKACARSNNLSILHHLHAHITKLGFTTHVFVATSLLYAYVLNSFELACLLFDEMPHKNTVTWNTMIFGYSKTGDVDRARQLFDLMPSKDLASWSATIAAYVNNRNYRGGLLLFQDMIVIGITPDQMAVGSILKGCAYMGSLGLLAGKSVHGFVVKNRWELNLELGTVLVDMYAKCGFFKYACQVFHLMSEKNVRTWTALICGLAQHGYCKEALDLFEMMRNECVEPNELTFTGILSACVHAGFVQEGRKYFNMIEEYGLETRIQHYGCMVDLLGRSGLLEEAYGVIKNMRLEPNIIVWSSLLSACKQHKSFDMAERVIEQILDKLEPENHGGIYSLISDLYVLEEKWDDAEKIRNLLNQNVRKVRAYSLIRSGL